MDPQLRAQALSLLGCIAYYLVLALCKYPYYVLRNLVLGPEKPQGAQDSVVFYEGTVSHARRAPKMNKFRYPVRTALVSLDNPPLWFSESAQAKDHMTADEARGYAGTDGPVWLLTNPTSAGYIVNPISVYYCHHAASGGGALDKCIAEVTNTPWAERVTFVFAPTGGPPIRKALHVSPLMDMTGTWILEAPQAGNTLKLVVRVNHPVHGNFFYADLVGVKCTGAGACARNEYAGLRTLLRYGLMPHRIAVWIYWQAAVLLAKGVPLYSPPPKAVLLEAAKGAAHPANKLNGCPFTWRPADGWPWDTWGEARAEQGAASSR